MNSEWLDRQREHFEAGAEGYASLYGDETPFHAAVTTRLLDLARVRPGERVLDLGCGSGRTTIPLLRAGCRVTGLDLSARGMELLTGRLEGLGLSSGFVARVASAEGLSDRRAFDLVIGRGLLHHLADPGPVLTRVRRALVPGGRAVFMDPNPFQPAWAAFVTLHPDLSWPIEYKLYRHTPAFNRRLFTAAGFERLRFAHLGLVPPRAWGFLPWAGRLEDRLRSLPGLRRLALYLVSLAKRSEATG